MTTGPISLRQDWQHTDGKAHVRLVDAYDPVEGVTKLAMLAWDTNTLAWVRYTPVGGAGGGGDASAANQTTEIARLTSINGKLPAIMSAAPGSDTGQDAIPVRVVSQLGAGTGGGGGGAVTVADGADVTQGAKADSAWDLAAAAPTTMGVFKKIAGLLDSIRVAVAGTLLTSTTQLPASLGANGGLKVEGVAGGVAVPVSNASLPLPSGASTGAKQDTGNTSVASIDTKTPALGQALAGASVPVVLPAAQITTLTPPAAITGFALESGHLAAIDTATARLPAQGQALAAASLPVVLTAIQQAALTPPAAITGYALDATVAKDGTDITGASMPAGGVGIRGWLSAIYTKLAASIAVTGTFWQTTQPVSIAAAVAVTGTFWQTTQPVSIAGTVTTNTGLSQPLTDTQLRASAVPISLATNTPDVTDRAGRLLGVIASITNAVTVTQAAITKGTQGATGVTTQDLKDSGRVAISFTAEFSPAAVAETMVTLSISKDGATATTGTSYTITSGKRFRIASKSIAVENTLGTSIQRAYLRTRFNTGGAAVVGSVLQANCIASASGTVKSTGSNFDDYPDGVEFLGDGTKAIGWSLQAPDWVTASATLKVYITIMAFEY